MRALGELDAYSNAIKALGVRETIRLLDGQTPGPASSIAKVATSVLLRRTFKATLELAGPLAMVEESEPAVVEPYLRLPAELIGGGTRQIQLNIIAQMILGPASKVTRPIRERGSHAWVYAEKPRSSATSSCRRSE